MTVLITNNTPPGVRGMLKRWFIEPKPNVFVGSINRKTRDRTIEYIRRQAPDLGMIIIASEPNSQGFIIHQHGAPDRRMVRYAGHYLVAEKTEG